MSGISNADSSYRPLYLQREYKGWRRRRRRRRGTRRLGKGPYIYIYFSLSTRYSCTVATCTAAVPFRPPDGRAAVADKLPHYAYAAYAPPKFAAGSPCSQPLKTLYFVRFLASFLIRYIYIYTPLLSLLLLSRASLVYDVSLCLSRFLVSPSRFSPEHPRRVGGSCHVHSIFYFLYRVATSFNVSRRFILRRIYRSR